MTDRNSSSHSYVRLQVGENDEKSLPMLNLNIDWNHDHDDKNTNDRDFEVLNVVRDH